MSQPESPALGPLFVLTDEELAELRDSQGLIGDMFEEIQMQRRARAEEARAREQAERKVADFEQAIRGNGQSLPDYWTAEKQLPFVLKALREAEGRGLECPTCGYGTNRMDQGTCENDGARLVVVTWKDRALSAVKAAQMRAEQREAMRIDLDIAKEERDRFKRERDEARAFADAQKETVEQVRRWATEHLGGYDSDGLFALLPR